MLHRGVGDDSQKFPRLLHRLAIEQFGLQILRLDGDFVQHVYKAPCCVYRAPGLLPLPVTGKIDAMVRKLAEQENITW